MSAPRYWLCIIGPVSSEKIPDGADFPPRMAARQAVANLVGETDTPCHSGWYDEDDLPDLEKRK